MYCTPHAVSAPRSSRLASHRTRQAGAERFGRSLDSRLRDECLNEHVFLTPAEARATIDAWRQDYNHLRPHSSLDALTPTAFAMLKRPEEQPPPQGENNHRRYL